MKQSLIMVRAFWYQGSTSMWNLSCLPGSKWGLPLALCFFLPLEGTWTPSSHHRQLCYSSQQGNDNVLVVLTLCLKHPYRCSFICWNGYFVIIWFKAFREKAFIYQGYANTASAILYQIQNYILWDITDFYN